MGEARLLAQFDHPSLVKVFRFWEANNTAYMVMPLYSGMTLRPRARCAPPLSLAAQAAVVGAGCAACCTTATRPPISQTTSSCRTTAPGIAGPAARPPSMTRTQAPRRAKVNYARPSSSIPTATRAAPKGLGRSVLWLAVVMHGCLANDTPLPATLRSIRDRMVSFSRIAKTVKRQFGVEYSAPFVAAISQSPGPAARGPAAEHRCLSPDHG